MTGGVAKNLAVRRELEKRLGMRTIDLPLDPQLIGAFGAAQLARRHASGRSSR
jgi:activator of 2-hydroxyglutaryl-CoA dehydratase